MKIPLIRHQWDCQYARYLNRSEIMSTITALTHCVQQWKEHVLFDKERLFSYTHPVYLMSKLRLQTQRSEDVFPVRDIVH